MASGGGRPRDKFQGSFVTCGAGEQPGSREDPFQNEREVGRGRKDDIKCSGHRHGQMGGFHVGFHPRQSELEAWHWEGQPCRFGEDQTVCPPSMHA